MTPAVLNRKIDSLRNCVQRIESKLPFTLEQLEQNYDLQDIVSINLERATQNSVDIAIRILSQSNSPSPSTMAESFDLLSKSGIISSELAGALKKSVGLRNMLVHEYSSIDWRIVHEVCHNHLGTYRKFVAAVLAKS